MLLSAVSLVAAAGLARAADFLPAELAFRLSGEPARDGVAKVVFDVADGYYLYRERLSVEPWPANVKLAGVELPAGQVKHDPTFEKDMEVYHGLLMVRVRIDPATPAGTPLLLKVGSQGCAEAGLCYPPRTEWLRVNLAEGGRVVAMAVATPAERQALGAPESVAWGAGASGAGAADTTTTGAAEAAAGAGGIASHPALPWLAAAAGLVLAVVGVAFVRRRGRR